MENYFTQHPVAKQQWIEREERFSEEDERHFKNGYKNQNEKQGGGEHISGTVYYIPLVFHVLHQNGPENISDTQILDAVSILNRDYRKLNSDTTVTISQFKGIAADAYIEFGLATIDPNGNCTNGMIHHYDAHTDWYSGNLDWYIYTWDPTKYLNVYIVNSIDAWTVGGYTYLPGTFASGNPADAVVIMNQMTGSIGTSDIISSRALTHEVGHWLNLQHTWGSSNSNGVTCGNDGVSDTPITQGSTTCDTALSVCNPPIIENAQNYMDYSFCSTMFTIGQVVRMRNLLASGIGGRSNVITASNLSATGEGLPLPLLCPDFAGTKRFICQGDSIQFRDSSSINLPVTSWIWSFAGGVPSASTDSSPVVHYNSGGTYAVSYTATNAYTSGSKVVNSYVTVYNASNALSVPFTEGFESSTVPGNIWKEAHTNVYGASWTVTNSAFSTGTKSVYLNNLNNIIGNISVLQSIPVNFASSSVPQLSFRKAFQRADYANADNLEVFVSTDCGTTWISVWAQSGASLSTVAGINTSPFVPTPVQFSTETIDISNITTSGLVQFKWVFTPDSVYPGNNIYLDDINIFDANTTGVIGKILHNDLTVYPNPSNGEFNISGVLARAKKISINVTDITGRTIEVISEKLYNAGEVKVNVGEKIKYRPGVYFIHVNMDEETIVKKVIVE